MKNQNPQEILNEILLRMKYDLGKTLTENKVLVEQMSNYYYDQFGNLKLEPVNTTKMPASQLYPEIKNGQYPKTIPSSDYDKKSALNTWYSTAFLRNKVQNFTPQSTTSKKSMISPQNYVPTSTTPEGRKKELDWYTSTYMRNQNPKLYVKDPGPKQNFDEIAKQEKISKIQSQNAIPPPPTDIDEIKEFQDFLDLWYDNWVDINGVKSDLNKDVSKGYGIFGPNSKRMWNNSEVQKKWKQNKLLKYQKKQIEDIKLATSSDYLGRNYEVLPGITYGDMINPESKKFEIMAKSRERQKQLEKEFGKLKKEGTTEITVGIGSSSWNTRIPQSSTLYFWSYEDHNYFEKFKNSVTFKSGSAEDWKYYLFPFGDTVKKDGSFYGSTPFKDRVMPVGKIKGFSFKSETQTWTFKQSLTSEEFLDEFGAIINGNYVKYNWTNFFEKTWWEENGPELLNLGSLALSFFPGTWPLLLLSAGMDLYAAKMQYDMGETEGAKLSVLLSLTPFIGKLAVKVNSQVSKNLMQKFANATTKSDVDNIIATLSKEELDTLKSIRDLGDLKSEIKTLSTSKEVSNAINTAAKKTPEWGKVGLKKTGLDIALAGTSLYTMWDNLKEEILAEMTGKQLINDLILTALYKEIKTKEEKDALDKISSQLGSVAVKSSCDALRKFIETQKSKKNEEEKKRKESFYSGIESILDFIESETSNINDKIGDEGAKKIIEPVKVVGEELNNNNDTEKIDNPESNK